MTTPPTKPPRKRERSTSLTLTLPSALAAKIAADAKRSVRTPAQQAVYVLMIAYAGTTLPVYHTPHADQPGGTLPNIEGYAAATNRAARLPVYPGEKEVP